MNLNHFDLLDPPMVNISPAAPYMQILPCLAFDALRGCVSI